MVSTSGSGGSAGATSRSSTIEKFSSKSRNNNTARSSRAFSMAELGLVERLLLTVLLKLRLDHVAVRHFAAAFQILADGERVLRLIQSLLRSGVLALRHDQGVVIFGDRGGEAAARNFHLGSRQRFGCGSALDAPCA